MQARSRTLLIALFAAGPVDAGPAETSRSVTVFGKWFLSNSGPAVCEHAYVRNAANLVCQELSGPGIQDVLDEGWVIRLIAPVERVAASERYQAEVAKMVEERRINPNLSPAVHPEASRCAPHIAVHCVGTQYVLERP